MTLFLLRLVVAWRDATKKTSSSSADDNVISVLVVSALFCCLWRHNKIKRWRRRLCVGDTPTIVTVLGALFYWVSSLLLNKDETQQKERRRWLQQAFKLLAACDHRDASSMITSSKQFLTCLLPVTIEVPPLWSQVVSNLGGFRSLRSFT